MYTFFCVFGFITIVISSIIINNIYNIFSINKITNYLHPANTKNILNEINLTVLPIIIWSLIEIPIIGNNNNYLIGFILKIIISCAIIYEIKFSLYLIIKKVLNFIDIISIVISSLVSEIVFYMILNSKPIINLGNYSYFVSILGIVIVFLLHSLIVLDYPRYKYKNKYKDKR